jgi:hypothetical protein
METMTTPTLSQLGEMTDEELNVRLCLCLGWEKLAEFDGWSADVCKSHMGKPDGMIGSPPPFCSDANAVAEVRKGMTGDQFKAFLIHLARLLESEHPTPEKGITQLDLIRELMNSTPRQQTICAIPALTP